MKSIEILIVFIVVVFVPVIGFLIIKIKEIEERLDIHRKRMNIQSDSIKMIGDKAFELKGDKDEH